MRKFLNVLRVYFVALIGKLWVILRKIERKQLIIRFLCAVLGCIIITACTERKIKKELDGVWFAKVERIQSFQQNLGLLFENDTLYSICKQGNLLLGKFQIIEDTIMFEDDYNKQIQKYLIKEHTADSLILSIGGVEQVFYNEILEFNDSLKFSRITLIIGKETQPEFIMILDSAGNVLTENRVNINEFSKKAFKLTTDELNVIDSFFKYSCIDRTDTVGWDLGYDGWSKSMKFEYGNKEATIRTIDITMPYRIQPIFHSMVIMATDRGCYP